MALRQSNPVQYNTSLKSSYRYFVYAYPTQSSIHLTPATTMNRRGKAGGEVFVCTVVVRSILINHVPGKELRQQKDLVEQHPEE